MNIYKRKENKPLIALVTVVLMAACIMIIYGILSLFTDKGSSRSVAVASSQSRNLSNEVATSGSIDTGNVLANKAPKKSKEKKSIKDLVKASKEDEEKYYKNTAFVGDSRTQGLQINAGIKSPDFFAGRGLNVRNVRENKIIKNKKGKLVTVIEALKDKDYQKIYICYGINELGWPYPNIFAEEYKKTIKEIQKIQPSAEIVVQAILPMTEEKSKKDKIFNIKNMKKFNKAIKKMAKDMGVTYVDLSPAVKNKKGFLPKGVTPDGIHMNSDYCKRLLAYIVNKKY